MFSNKITEQVYECRQSATLHLPHVFFAVGGSRLHLIQMTVTLTQKKQDQCADSSTQPQCTNVIHRRITHSVTQTTNMVR